MREKKLEAIRIILAMKRHYSLKKDKYEIDKTIEYYVKKYNITYGDISEFKKSYKWDLILKSWIKKSK